MHPVIAGAMLVSVFVVVGCFAAVVERRKRERQAKHEAWLRERQANREATLARLDSLTAGQHHGRGPSV